MFGKIVRVGGFLVAGPTLSYLLLLAGCAGAEPYLGVMCGHNAMTSLFVLTVATWFVLAMAGAVVSSVPRKQ